MRKNGLAPVIIILIIAILGVVGYMGYKSYLLKLTPTNIPSASLVPTTNWKTYEDSAVGFQFKYPSDWLSTAEKVYPKPACPSDTNDCVGAGVSINVYDLNGRTLNKLATELNIKGDKNSDPIIVEPEALPNLLPENIIKLDPVLVNYMGMDAHSVVYIPKGNRAVELNLDIASDTADSILSTFKFTK